jgi:hypothetical protein
METLKHAPRQKKPPGLATREDSENGNQARSILIEWSPSGQVTITPLASPPAVNGSAESKPVEGTSDGTSDGSYVTKNDLAKLLVKSRRTIDRLEAGGLLPPPDIVVNRSAMWLRDTIDRFLRSRPSLKLRVGRS